MKKSQKTILKIIIILSIFLIIIIAVTAKIKKENQEHKYVEIDEIDVVKTLEHVKIRNSFFAAEKCINKFFSYYISAFVIDEDYYGTNNIESKKEFEQQNLNVLYNMLDEEFINEKGVTKDNIKIKLREIKDSNFNITDMYVTQQNNNVEIYVVKGVLKEKSTLNIKDFIIMLKLDVVNLTFSIVPQEYIEEKYSDLIVGEEIGIEIPKSINKNENNTFKYNAISDDTYVTNLFRKFKLEMQNFTQVAYERLDEKYKTKKFGTFETFQDYVKNNIEKYSAIQVVKFQRKVTDDYTQYICIDQNENYYIFRENAIMDYTVILDNYTIDLPEFLEEYNSSQKNEKVLLNMQKVINATKDGDYKYVYSKLDEQFKSANFKTQTEFEQYIKEKFDPADTIIYKSYEEINGISVYDIEANDVSESKTIEAQIVMQLKEGTDFVMSFSGVE